MLQKIQLIDPQMESQIITELANSNEAYSDELSQLEDLFYLKRILEKKLEVSLKILDLLIEKTSGPEKKEYQKEYIETCLKLECYPSGLPIDHLGRTALHIGAQLGDPESFEKILNFMKEKRINIKAEMHR
jgi:hypothetical protein